MNIHKSRQADRQEIKKNILLPCRKYPSIHFNQNYLMYRQNIFAVLLYIESKKTYLTSQVRCNVSRLDRYSLVYLKVSRPIIQLQSLYRTPQGRQRESCLKTLRSPLCAEFWRHGVLSGGT